MTGQMTVGKRFSTASGVCLILLVVLAGVQSVDFARLRTASRR